MADETEGFPPEPDLELPLDLPPREEARAVTQTLWDNEWVSLKLVRHPAAGVHGYVYSHETRCRGRIVAVLPYRDTPSGREYLVKREMTPCWGFDRVRSAVTGGWEGGDIEDDAVHEMLEETGYQVTREELVPLGESWASKSADTVYALFAVNLTGKVAGEAVGDGTEQPNMSEWITPSALAGVMDPQVHVMYGRLAALHPAVPPAAQNGTQGRPARVEVKGFRDLGIVRVSESTLAGEPMLRAETADGAVAEFPASSLHFITWLPEGTPWPPEQPRAITFGGYDGDDLDEDEVGGYGERPF